MTLTITNGEQGLKALLSRAVALDANALLRLQPKGDVIEAFVTTPFEVLASRRVTGTVEGDTVFRAADWTPALAAWPGALPPVSGFEELDIIPVDVVRELADQGRDLARQFSGPLGPPKSLLDQTVLEVTSGTNRAEITMRAIFTCTSLGLIPGIATHPDIPRHLRVATAGRWTRIDAPFGSVYQSKGLALLV